MKSENELYLEEVFRKKKERGLVSTSYTYNKEVPAPTREELIDELANFERAIEAGKVTPLKFGDVTLKKSTEVSNRKPRQELCPDETFTLLYGTEGLFYRENGFGIEFKTVGKKSEELLETLKVMLDKGLL